MRLIIKPAGLLVLVAALVGLAILAFSHQRQQPTTATTAAKDDDKTTASITPINAGGSSSSATQPGHTEDHELLPTPGVASNDWTTLGDAGSMDSRVFDSKLQAYPKMRRLTVLKLPEHYWAMQLRQTAKGGAITTGSHLRLRLWARSKDSCPITVACEHNDKPYEKLATRDFTLTPQWQQYDMEWIADRDEPAGWAQVSLQFGGKVGEIDIASASLVSSTAKS